MHTIFKPLPANRYAL